jgi:Domain of unknown function (DUF4118)
VLSNQRRAVLSAVVGPLLAVAVAWATSSVGEDAGEGRGLANVALVLAGITVAAALVSWLGGVTTSVAAALALNWFHTEPRQTFRISSRTDVASVLLLGALGIGVSAITAVRVRSATRAGRAIDAARVRRDVTSALSTPLGVRALWHASIDAASPDLGLVDARLMSGSPDARLPVLSRREWSDDAERATVVLPSTGAAVQLRGDERRWVLLRPRAGMGTLTVDRRAVAAFVDALTLALTPTVDPTAGRHPAGNGVRGDDSPV